MWVWLSNRSIPVKMNPGPIIKWAQITGIEIQYFWSSPFGRRITGWQTHKVTSFEGSRRYGPRWQIGNIWLLLLYEMAASNTMWRTTTQILGLLAHFWTLYLASYCFSFLSFLVSLHFQSFVVFIWCISDASSLHPDCLNEWARAWVLRRASGLDQCF